MSERDLLYLHLSDDFEGGQLSLFQWGCSSVVPQKGKGLYFANPLYMHRGEPVVSGENI